MHLVQSPAPSSSLLRHSGDDIVFELRVEGAPASGGRAVLRTSLGGAKRKRRELVEAMDADRPPLALDWNDVPMEEVGRADAAGIRRFAVRLPLVDIGSFHAKACFFPEGSDRPFWPEGGDVLVKVAPAWTVCWSSIYCAFPRQFGANCALERSAPLPEGAAALDAAGWSAIPREGTLRDLVARLDTILLDERFRIVQLLPVHPVPTTFARMGRFGSPFASTDFLAVNPGLAEFDTAATPLDQFRELADAVHTRGARLFIDLPANHTGWASALQTHHPEWFRREPDGRFHSPGAWGTVWEDLVELDHARPELRAFLASVFEFWCAQGVDGFRCDAGYMVPAETWRYVVARVREQFPDTVFLLEGLGGKISVTRNLIAEEGLDWAYSEIFQTEDRSAFERYLPGAEAMSAEVGPLAHYAETHDNNRLAARSRAYARMRTALAALASRQGCFGITNGVEWFATEKVDVHGASALRWGAPDNQVAAVRRLNTILAAFPAFAAGASLEMVQCGEGNSLALLRRARKVEEVEKGGEGSGDGFEEGDGLGGDALAGADRAELLHRGGLHGDGVDGDAERRGEALAHLLDAGGDLRRLGEDREVGVGDAPALAAQERDDGLEEPDAVRALPLRVGVGEEVPDVAERGGAEERVHQRVRRRVGVRVAEEAEGELELDAAQDEPPPRDEAVDVEAGADAEHGGSVVR